MCKFLRKCVLRCCVWICCVFVTKNQIEQPEFGDSVYLLPIEVPEVRVQEAGSASTTDTDVVEKAGKFLNAKQKRKTRLCESSTSQTDMMPIWKPIERELRVREYRNVPEVEYYETTV